MKMKRFLVVIAPTLLLAGSLNSCNTQDYYTVTFESEGGSKVNSINLPIFEVYEKGSAVKKANLDKPTDPTKDQSDFLYWTADGVSDFFADGSKVSISGDTTLYAVWDDWGLKVDDFAKWKSGIESTYGNENNYSLSYFIDYYSQEKGMEGSSVVNNCNKDSVKRNGKNSVISINSYKDGESVASYQEYEKFDDDANAFYKFDFKKGLSFEVSNESNISNLIKDGKGESPTYGLSKLVDKDMYKKFGHSEGNNVTYSYNDEENYKTYVVKFNTNNKLSYYSLIEKSELKDKDGNDLYNTYVFKFTNYDKTEISSSEMPSVPGKNNFFKDDKGDIKTGVINADQTYNCTFNVDSSKKNYTIALTDDNSKTVKKGFKEFPKVYVDGILVKSEYNENNSSISFSVDNPSNSSKALISCSTIKEVGKTDPSYPIFNDLFLKLTSK